MPTDVASAQPWASAPRDGGLSRRRRPGPPRRKRAIPPRNLDEYSASNPPFNYHLYEVTAPFTVEAGPIRPWFNQPGLGTHTTPAPPSGN
ncbi:TNT domain-containing protein [Streptomyces sp. NPDC050743]|uniref:TNT domain-containing protein n=1 Tax=Streptomyces sp. NPDC050743 TaxID=3365634 RepID=UPI00379EDF5F